jgi:Protein of unknown function (DUF1573)
VKRLALAFSLLAALGPGAGADAPPPSPAAAPRLVVEPSSFDFGTVKAGRVVQKEFLLRNAGRADLVLDSVVSSCGCAAVVSESRTVRPGGSTPLRVRLTAPDKVGPLQKSVLIKSNDPARPALEVKLEAVVAGAKDAGR